MFEYLVQLTVFNLGWNILALKELLGSRAFLGIVF